MNNFYSDASIIILIFLPTKGKRMAYKLTNDPNKLHINTEEFIKTMAIPLDRVTEKMEHMGFDRLLNYIQERKTTQRN